MRLSSGRGNRAEGKGASPFSTPADGLVVSGGRWSVRRTRLFPDADRPGKWGDEYASLPLLFFLPSFLPRGRPGRPTKGSLSPFRPLPCELSLSATSPCCRLPLPSTFPRQTDRFCLPVVSCFFLASFSARYLLLRDAFDDLALTSSVMYLPVKISLPWYIA